jgi:hypothetical protein
MMYHDEFLERVINEGIEAAQKDYADKPERLNGSLAGFEACRDKNTLELAELLSAATTASRDARMNENPDYWWYRCYELEVEWVCNCVSAVLWNQGLPTIITPTARGLFQAAKIIGVKGQ